VQGSPRMQQQLGGLDLGAPVTYEGAPGPAAPVAIPESLRLRVREQVGATVALLQAGTPLTLGDVLAAPDAAAYIFQTAQPLLVTEQSGGGECFLNTGDLIGFLQHARRSQRLCHDDGCGQRSRQLFAA
jgi:hypothetical protein